MKIIQWLVRWLSARKKKKPPSPERVPPANDDSPPGHKIRWHH